jgi:[FeFe] hydrogenase H-cluster maturation GTPase HydF
VKGQGTPRGFRLHIGIFGRRNVGKSSLLNAFVRQRVSLVSDTAGTTTDPVEKPMEMLPLGPVVFIDTAGIDDVGALGELRVARTRQVLDRADLALVVAVGEGWGEFEEGLVRELADRKVPVVAVFNQADRVVPPEGLRQDLARRGIPTVVTSALTGLGMGDLREAVLRAAPPEAFETPTILGDLVPPGEMAVLVVPIDKEAPKGRLILPQVQTIRDLLDHDGAALVVKERELRAMLDLLRRPPRLVVTDSQAFPKVAADTPPDVPMTSFSILFSRLKGDLVSFVEGAMAVEDLRPGDRVLVAEACTHHPIGEDIGRVKIPRWLERYVGGHLEFVHVQGHDFPEDLSPFRLVIHCGACTQNRREVLNRLLRCRAQEVPMTNYGLVIAWSLGIFERALSPFPGALEAFRARKREGRP